MLMILTFVCFRFSEITLREVLGSRPPRAFRNMDRAEREQLYWALKAQTTAQRGQELLEQQALPVRFGPNRGQTSQPRRGRRARVLSSEQRRERLAHGQAAMDVGGGEVRRHLVDSLLTGFLCRHKDSIIRAIRLHPRCRPSLPALRCHRSLLPVLRCPPPVHLLPALRCHRSLLPVLR